MGVLRRSWKTIWSTPLGDLDQQIRLAEGKFFEPPPKLIENCPPPIDYLTYADTTRRVAPLEFSGRATGVRFWRFEGGVVFQIVKDRARCYGVFLGLAPVSASTSLSFCSPRKSVGQFTSVTRMIPWSSGEDAWMTPRKSAVRFCPGSLKRRSVGVVAARRCGKAEDRVQVPNGPLTNGLACTKGGD